MLKKTYGMQSIASANPTESVRYPAPASERDSFVETDAIPPGWKSPKGRR
jgi:hypothetical protein